MCVCEAPQIRWVNEVSLIFLDETENWFFFTAIFRFYEHIKCENIERNRLILAGRWFFFVVRFILFRYRFVICQGIIESYLDAIKAVRDIDFQHNFRDAVLSFYVGTHWNTMHTLCELCSSSSKSHYHWNWIISFIEWNDVATSLILCQTIIYSCIKWLDLRLNENVAQKINRF